MAGPLDVIIVGSGLGGLCAAVALSLKGHQITILEQGESISETGAGIQSGPYFTRLLYNWGLKSGLEKYAVKPQYMHHRRWQDTSQIAKIPINAGDAMERLYGYPHYHIHRADFQLILLNRAQENGVSVEVNTKVMGFEPAKSAKEKDSVVTNHGVRLTADLIIAADGLRSSLKTIVLGEAAESVPVGDSAYRALLPASYLEDPAFDGLDMKGNLTVWLGPDRHVVSYWVKDLEVLNMVIIVPDDNTSEEENWRAQGDVKKMRDAFEGWDWRLRRLLDLVDSSYIWRLRDRNALKTWVHPEGNLALLGDSAHPMLPYAAAGAASAAEDAAALAECLDHVGGDGGRSIKDALRVYEAIRVPRATQMVEQSRANRKLFHMHDGPSQQQRDAALRENADKNKTSPYQSPVRNEMFTYDVILEVKKHFERVDGARI